MKCCIVTRKNEFSIRSPALRAGLFVVRQACVSAIGCKSWRRFTVGSLSQEQGCRGWPRIWRKLAANVRAYEQKLHIRRGCMDNVAIETEVRYCTEYNYVDAEATWTESGYTYPGRSANDYSFNAEVSRGHIRLGYEPSERMEVSRTTEGPNVRMAKELGSLWQGKNNRTT